MNTRRAYWLALGLITAWFASRWPAAWYAYPFAGFQDEPYLVDVAHAMVRDGTLNPRFFNYPSLSFDLLAGLYWLGDLTGALPIEGLEGAALSRPAQLGPNGLGAHGIGPSPDHYVWARLMVLSMATLTVPITAELGRRLIGPLTALAAALLLATNPLFTSFSYLGTVNPPLALWCALAGLGAAVVLRRGARADYLFAGVAAGLALGTKYVAFPAALLAPLAHLFATRYGPSERRGRLLSWSSWSPLLLFGSAAVAVLLLSSPYILLDFEAFWRDLGRTGQVYSFKGDFHFHEGQGGNSWREIAERFAGGSMRWVPSACAAFGLGWLLLGGRKRQAALLALVPLVSWAFLGSYTVSFPRNLMGALPFLCILGGAGIGAAHALCARFAGPAAAGAASAALLAYALSNPLVYSLAEIDKDLQIDTRRAALEWVEQHVPPGSSLVREERTPPIEEFLTGYQVRYMRSVARPDRFAELAACDFVLLTVPFRRDLKSLEEYTADRAKYAAFMESHELVAEFIGGQDRLSGRRIAIYAVPAIH